MESQPEPRSGAGFATRFSVETGGSWLYAPPPLFGDPLAKFGPLEELNAGDDDNQTDDGEDQQIQPDGPICQGRAGENL